MSGAEVVITGPIETALLLAALVRSGSLDGCVVCRFSSVWRHPQHGGLHPQCAPRLLAMLTSDTGGDARTASPVRRGAYARHG